MLQKGGAYSASTDLNQVPSEDDFEFNVKLKPNLSVDSPSTTPGGPDRRSEN